MRKIIGVVCILLSIGMGHALQAAPDSLSADAEVSVITAAAGGELYTVFGHTTIRIRDPLRNLDKVYNYGTFDFGEPGFYWHFARGYLHYYLETTEFEWFRRFYLMLHRSLYEQVLQLTHEQQQALYVFLENNALEENRYYRYDSFLNNCSTKVRDALQEILAGYSGLNDSAFTAPRSFREYIAPYLHQRSWGGFGINLLLGALTDQPASAFQSMFLPNQLKNRLAAAIIRINGETLPLVKNIRTYPAPPGDFNASGAFRSPALLFWFIGLVLAGLTVFEWRSGRLFFPVDGVLLTIMGLMGCLLLFLWVGSVRPWTDANFNLIWALPTHLIAGLFLLKKRKPAFLGSYFFLTTGLTLLLLMSWRLIPQTLPGVLLPVLVVMTLRMARLAKSLG